MLIGVKSETIKGEFRIPHNKKKFKSWQLLLALLSFYE